jgi:general stress protein 26
MMKQLFLLQFLWLLVWVPSMAASEDAEILDLARQTIEKARYATFATVDANGQPRTRIVDPFVPDEAFVIYVATKPNTRKVEQIGHNPLVTLFYFDPAGRNYVSVMGRAELVTDEAIKRQMRRATDGDKIYPDFPADYVLIKVSPRWIEGLLPGYRGDPDNWRPISVQMNGDKP